MTEITKWTTPFSLIVGVGMNVMEPTAGGCEPLERIYIKPKRSEK